MQQLTEAQAERHHQLLCISAHFHGMLMAQLIVLQHETKKHLTFAMDYELKGYISGCGDGGFAPQELVQLHERLGELFTSDALHIRAAIRTFLLDNYPGYHKLPEIQRGAENG